MWLRSLMAGSDTQIFTMIHTTFICLVLVPAVSAGGLSTSSTSNEGFHRLREYCESESFRPRCDKDEVIVMQSSTYGRMRLGRCVTTDLGYLGCSSNVLAIADARCSGRRQCQIRIPDPEMDATQPCFKELKIYLTASFTCISVVTPINSQCHGEQVVRAHSQWGYLASLTTSETGCGSQASPWIIEAPEEHRINLTLFDFLSFDERKTRYFSTDEHCLQYGKVLDTQESSEVPICRTTERVRHIYLSKSNRVSVSLSLHKDDTHQGTFVIRYEVIGCKYGGDCNQEPRTEGCKGNNCTQHTSSSYQGGSNNLTFLGQGASIAIILCISITVSLLMLIFGAIILKCHKLGHGPLCLRRRASPGGNTERHACVYTDHVDCTAASTAPTPGLHSRDFEIRTCYFDPRCRDYLSQTSTTQRFVEPCKDSQQITPADTYMTSSRRAPPHKTTCTLEMETTSGLVLRGVLSKMEESELGEMCPTQRFKPEGDEGRINSESTEGVNLYVFNDNKCQEHCEEFTPECERKIMVI